ncbi:hypothetical protein OF83DRAFT_1109923 [Amylostereum chailletii]|nr:hypothetical protein OF83DRAFT_1109923 [Amylostereum chailletii]
MTFKDDRGRKYTWKSGETERSVELYSESSDREPIVRFERSFRDFHDPLVPIVVPAQIVYHTSAEDLMDSIIVAFFLIERHRRQRDKGVLSRGGAGAIAMATAI